MKLIVGLGNPGEEYKMTRHNIGFIFIDEYLAEKNIGNMREKFKSVYAEMTYKGEKIFFQKPMTYMNASGEAIGELVKFYKIDPATELFVIYDDMDMEFGKIKVRKDGRSAGHNGIKSIIQHVGEKFVRIKYGIGKAKIKEETIGHVLGKFKPEEKEKIKEDREKIFALIEDIKNDMEIDRLMNKYNKKG